MKYLLYFALGISSAIAADPTALLPNGIAIPDAIDVSSQSFLWVMNVPDRAEPQYGVANRGFLGSIDHLGQRKTNSASTSFVHKTGSALTPATKYIWKVKPGNKAGSKSPFS